MTLSTDIGIIGGNASAREAYDFINSFLSPGRTPMIDAEGWNRDGTIKYLGNRPGQGLPAWLGITYREGAPLHEEDTFSEPDEYIEEPYLLSKACDFKINFDTAYGYRDEFGGCSDLHTRYIIALNAWITAKGGHLWWHNEFTGDYFDGVNGLDEFGQGGLEAREWFEGTVKPAVEALIPEGSGIVWL